MLVKNYYKNLVLKPLLVGSGFAFLGLLLLSLTFLPNVAYIISSIIGYLLFGIGLGTYATPSTDTRLQKHLMIK